MSPAVSSSHDDNNNNNRNRWPRWSTDTHRNVVINGTVVARYSFYECVTFTVTPPSTACRSSDCSTIPSLYVTRQHTQTQIHNLYERGFGDFFPPLHTPLSLSPDGMAVKHVDYGVAVEAIVPTRTTVCVCVCIYKRACMCSWRAHRSVQRV
jgi:hypothetical protein